MLLRPWNNDRLWDVWLLSLLLIYFWISCRKHSQNNSLITSAWVFLSFDVRSCDMDYFFRRINPCFHASMLCCYWCHYDLIVFGEKVLYWMTLYRTVYLRNNMKSFCKLQSFYHAISYPFWHFTVIGIKLWFLWSMVTWRNVKAIGSRRAKIDTSKKRALVRFLTAYFS